jgi:pantetheine-phosphate adenylyltransferase
MKIGIYPGTFDPVTYGHIDIIKRGVELFDKLIIGVAINSNKQTLFSAQERLAMINNEISSLTQSNKIIAVKFSGLLVEFAKKNNSNFIIRGLRAVSDFEYEFQMFGMNSKLDPNIQTIFLPASENNQFIASKLVKEVAKLGGDTSKFITPYINKKLLDKING